MVVIFVVAAVAAAVVVLESGIPRRRQETRTKTNQAPRARLKNENAVRQYYRGLNNLYRVLSPIVL